MELDPIARERLYRRFVAEEVLADLRHSLINKLSGVGALAFHLRRQLPPEAGAGVWPLLDGEIAQATAALDRRLLEPARPELVPLAATAIAALRSVRRPGLELAAPGAEATVLAAPDELALALACLIENACEAVPAQGGQIEVRIAARDTALVALEVIDNGPGLDPRAGEPFFTTRPGRLGLGLNVAGRVAQRAGGRLALEGSCVRLVFPLPAGAP
jgi:signal transduction histidine kinase